MSVIHYSRHLSAQQHSEWQLLRLGHIECGLDHKIKRKQFNGHDWIYCVKGRGVARVDGEDLAFGRGDLFWIDNQTEHMHKPDAQNPWELLWLRVDHPLLAQWRRDSYGEAGVQRTQQQRLFPPLWTALRDLCEQREVLSTTQFIVQQQMILSQIVALFISARTLGDDDVVRRCQRMLQTDLQRQWTTSELEAVLHISSSQLHRQFHQHVGVPPLKWFKQLRMEQAADVLVQSDQPIQAIASSVGYEDPFHFSREFRKHFGRSPRQYRKDQA